MIIRSKAWHICVSSLVFFVVCQISTLALLPKTLICNSGVSFSVNTPVFVLIPAIITSLFFIAGILRALLQRKVLGHLAIVGGSLLFGGAFSNIADRLFRGCVPDFFHIFFFPTFNVADMGISMGAILLLISMFHKNKETNNPMKKF